MDMAMDHSLELGLAGKEQLGQIVSQPAFELTTSGTFDTYFIYLFIFINISLKWSR